MTDSSGPCRSCPVCGKEIPREAFRCTHCNTPLARYPVEGSPTEDPLPGIDRGSLLMPVEKSTFLASMAAAGVAASLVPALMINPLFLGISFGISGPALLNSILTCVTGGALGIAIIASRSLALRMALFAGIAFLLQALAASLLFGNEPAFPNGLPDRLPLFGAALRHALSLIPSNLLLVGTCELWMRRKSPGIRCSAPWRSLDFFLFCGALSGMVVVGFRRLMFEGPRQYDGRFSWQFSLDAVTTSVMLFLAVHTALSQLFSPDKSKRFRAGKAGVSAMVLGALAIADLNLAASVSHTSAIGFPSDAAIMATPSLLLAPAGGICFLIALKKKQMSPLTTVVAALLAGLPSLWLLMKVL